MWSTSSPSAVSLRYSARGKFSSKRIFKRLGVPPAARAQEHRVALVIGNSAYQKVAKLSNPANDAAAVAAMLTHEDIARHAHEIYVEKGCRQGQDEQDWLQAEQELKNQRNWLQAGQDTKTQDQAGEPSAY